MSVFTETVITGGVSLIGITLISLALRLLLGKTLTTGLFNRIAPGLVLFTMAIFIWTKIGYFHNLPGTIILTSLAVAIIVTNFILIPHIYIKKLEKPADNLEKSFNKISTKSLFAERADKPLGAEVGAGQTGGRQKTKKVNTFSRKFALSATAIAIVAASVGYLWLHKNLSEVPSGFTLGNGRIEATEIEIATKLPGRLSKILVREGDSVEAGQVLAQMDTLVLEAQLKEAQAMVRQAKELKKSSSSMIAGKASTTKLASKEFERSSRLIERGSVSRQRYDYDETNLQRARSEHAAAVSQRAEAQAAIEAAEARVERLKAEINDGVLVSPRNGRVSLRIAEPGEILPAGGKVMTVIDMDDIYMTLFLPGKDAGVISLGADAKVILDGLPQRSFPAKVTYVSEKSQFTPREVETREERQKLVFRVKVNLTEKDDHRLKSGMTGVTYIRLVPSISWPASIP